MRMQVRQLPFQAPPSSVFSPVLGQIVKPLDPLLSRLFFRERMLRSIPEAGGEGLSAARFAYELLHNLAIRCHVPRGDLERIPPSGATLVVANHPFGLLEGLLLISMLESVRADFRIVANGLLSGFPLLRERVIFVNPFEERSVQENRKSLRESLAWLSQGGLLVMFPAGEVSHLNWDERSVIDPKWNTAAARFARKISCPTLPLFFNGANSRRFQMVGTIHPRLRTLNLLNELLNKQGQEIKVRIGTPVSASVLRSFEHAESATAYLRVRTYLLQSRTIALGSTFRPLSGPRCKPVAQPAPRALLKSELAELPAERLLARNNEFSVYLASANEIPNTLQEVGRCREVSYREVGEGTGRPIDTDQFDSYYRHIILWHPADARVAGAYRVAATPDVLKEHGVSGLYSSTLFHYDLSFFEQIGPALELGPSFICRDYQKRYSPLLLLWKGILRYVAQRPECAVLFGAVSVSSDYQLLSRTLIVDFLNGHITNDVSRNIRPRQPFSGSSRAPKSLKQLGRLLPTVDELSATIQDLEADGKGLPILIKQYLKIGGQLLGFNVDRQFSNSLDVLVMANLRTASGPMLDRCMGRLDSESFRASHFRSSSQVETISP